MKRRSFAMVIAALMCTLLPFAWAANQQGKTGAGISGKQPSKMPEGNVTKDGVLALAEKYIKIYQPKLEGKSKDSVAGMNEDLERLKNIPSVQKQTINTYVNQLTIALADLRSFEGLIVASAYLVKFAPESFRTANLFGASLHTCVASDPPGKDALSDPIIAERLRDAGTVFQYILSFSPENKLARLNLANVYLDLKQYEKARALAEKVLFLDNDCRDAWRVIATYWYKKNDMSQFRNALLRAAKFRGFVRRKVDEKKRPSEETEEPKPTDTEEQLAAKTEKIKDSVPLTTADIIADDYPNESRQIRDKYGRLSDGETVILPELPQTNTNTPKDYQENFSIVEQWASIFTLKYQQWGRKQMDKEGINPAEADENASDAEILAADKKNQAIAKKQLAEALQKTQQMIKSMQNTPGVTPADLAELKEAMKQLQQSAKDENIELQDKPAAGNPLPGSDSGSIFAVRNYIDYMFVRHAHEIYIWKMFQNYRANEADILKVYHKKVAEEDRFYEDRMNELKDEYDRAKESGAESAKQIELKMRQETLRHKKQVNLLGDDYYKQWVNLYMPYYKQKIKPTLEKYWRQCMLYIKNMNNPEVLRREYLVVAGQFFNYATEIGGHIEAGKEFVYLGSTEEEEQELLEAMRAAEEEARAKESEMRKAYKEPEFSLEDWLEKHLIISIRAEFLSLKVSPSSIEFEAWAFGPAAGLKLDFDKETFSTYTGVGWNWNVGVNIAGLEAGVEASANLVRKNAIWDFGNGTYHESYTTQGDVKAYFGSAALTADAELDLAVLARISDPTIASDTYGVPGGNQ